jgi:hypothetical protein
MQPKKFSEYTPITETDGSEVIPILKAGVNATVKSEDLPISTATQTAIDAADADIAAHIADVANPHEVTKTQVGLGNADNTSDANKPVSTAQATAIALKADTTYVDSQDALKADQATTYTKTEVDTKDTAVADTAQSNLTAHTSNTSNPHSTTKSQVGLGNVDNTSDVDKPVSTATQTALDAKATNTSLDAHTNNTSNPHSVTKTQVGLGNVDNTADSEKPVSTPQQTALDGKATKLDIPQFSVPYRSTVGTGEANTNIAVRDSAATAGSIATRDGAGAVHVATATATTHAVNKAQMDTADALKVAKAGDTMTGNLATLRLSPVTNLTYDLGTASLYYSNLYARRLNLNATAYFDGTSAGIIAATGVLTSTSAASSANAMFVNTGALGDRASINLRGYNASNSGDYFTTELRTDTTELVMYVYDASVPAYITLLNFAYLTGVATFSQNLAVADGKNISLGASTGTKIGTATTQKLGFYNSTPIVQPTGNAIAALTALGLLGGTPTVGASGSYIGNTYTTRINLNATSYIDGATPGSMDVTGLFKVGGNNAVVSPTGAIKVSVSATEPTTPTLNDVWVVV